MTQPTYTVYADGACSGNPGPGGWAFEILINDVTIDALKGSHGATDTTNNIMELEAAIGALKLLAQDFTHAPGKVLLRLDSQYVLQGLFEWIDGWKARGWKGANKKPVKNRELWEKLDELKTHLEQHGFSFIPSWVKGHAGEPGNERVDTEAQNQRDLFASIASSPSDAVLGYNNAGFDDPTRSLGIKPLPSNDVDPNQVNVMQAILARYSAGDISVKDVVRDIRANAAALGVS